MKYLDHYGRVGTTPDGHAVYGPVAGGIGGMVGAAVPMLSDDVKHQKLGAQLEALRHGENALNQLMHHFQQQMDAMMHEHHAAMTKHHETHGQADAIVGFDTVSNVGAGANFVAFGTPTVPCQLDQLVIPSSLTASLLLAQVQNGMKIINGGAGNFAAAQFSELSVLKIKIDLGYVAAGTQIQVQGTWQGASPQRVWGSFLGKNLDNPCPPGQVFQNTPRPPFGRQHPGHPGHPANQGHPSQQFHPNATSFFGTPAASPYLS